MRHKKWLLSLTIITGNTVLLLVLLEGATRVLWHDDVDKQHIGIVLNGVNREVVHEGVRYNTNSFGLRNREVEVQKSAGTKRILALGDSFTWGDGLPGDELITVKMETLLKPDFPGVEVING